MFGFFKKLFGKKCENCKDGICKCDMEGKCGGEGKCKTGMEGKCDAKPMEGKCGAEGKCKAGASCGAK